MKQVKHPPSHVFYLFIAACYRYIGKAQDESNDERRNYCSYNVVASLWYPEWLPAIKNEQTRLQITYLVPK